jgi:hypothetical protein
VHVAVAPLCGEPHVLYGRLMARRNPKGPRAHQRSSGAHEGVVRGDSDSVTALAPLPAADLEIRGGACDDSGRSFLVIKQLALAAALAAGVACHARRERIEPAPPLLMPPECEQVLADLDCWLRSGDNAPVSVTQVVESLRASFRQELEQSGESDLHSRCADIARLRSEAFVAVGCGHAPLLSVPASAPPKAAPCGRGAFFFIRKDAKIVGCHLECETAADCPAPQSCTGWGSAVGGPTDQPFCE